MKISKSKKKFTKLNLHAFNHNVNTAQNPKMVEMPVFFASVTL